ncbi:MAG: protein kinase [Candidatus Pacebacteria bacterium]|nr:protein kinase [Candidatus Paceibacterota bacterium]
MGCTGASKPKSSRKVSQDTSVIMGEFKHGRLQNFEFKKVLGHGKYGQVFLATSSESGQLVAIKAIRKSVSDFSTEQLTKEIDILSQVDHPNIVKYIEHFQTDKYLFIVMEYCAGGDLFDKIVKCGKLGECEAAALMAEILRAVNHCHHLGLIHRDLKPENLMYSKEGLIKLIDFGLSMRDKAFSEERIAGTAYYIAPEILRDEIFTKACDIWSLGIILHILLTGNIPIVGHTHDEIYDSILSYQGPTFSGEVWTGVSEEAKDLLRRMLEPVHTKRITAADALNHPWFQLNKEEHAGAKPWIIQSLKEYSGYSKLKKKALNLLVQNMDELDIKRLQDAFIELDEDHTGLITCSDLKACLKNEGYDMTAEELESLTRRVNYNGDGYINYTDFLAATLSTKLFLTEEKMWSVFRTLDVGKKGCITEQDLKTALGKRKRLQSIELEGIMKDTDRDHDGKITFEEFKWIFRDELVL